MPQEKTPPTMLCPACKTRMSTRQIATASFNKFVYHCPHVRYRNQTRGCASLEGTTPRKHLDRIPVTRTRICMPEVIGALVANTSVQRIDRY
jgi:hypothetical protein